MEDVSHHPRRQAGILKGEERRRIPPRPIKKDRTGSPAQLMMKNKVYLIWLINDDVDPMVVGIATSEDKANSMRDKLASTDGFEFNDYEIIEMNADTVIIDDVEYRF